MHAFTGDAPLPHNAFPVDVVDGKPAQGIPILAECPHCLQHPPRPFEMVSSQTPRQEESIMHCPQCHQDQPPRKDKVVLSRMISEISAFLAIQRHIACRIKQLLFTMEASTPSMTTMIHSSSNVTALCHNSNPNRMQRKASSPDGATFSPDTAAAVSLRFLSYNAQVDGNCTTLACCICCCLFGVLGCICALCMDDFKDTVRLCRSCCATHKASVSPPTLLWYMDSLGQT